MLIEGEVGRIAQTCRLPILIYDADCDFCARWVGRIRSWDRGQAVYYLPLQDKRAPGLTGRRREDLQQAVHLVRTDGVVFAGAAAARELFGCLPGGAILGSAMRIPGLMPLAARMYARIARRFGPAG